MIDPALAKSIRLVGLDVDGVMTDGGLYIGAVDGRPMEFKRYEIQDGLGVQLLKAAGIKVIIATGRVSDSVRLRALDLDVDDYSQDAKAFKLGGFLSSIEKFGIEPRECAFVGDDFPDLAVLRLVGLPVAVRNAVPEILRECRVHLTRTGGRGAVREFAELLLKARGEWTAVWQQYVAERSEVARGATT
jgi:3-deoxy-D-manno-octulosonate 8-phosphate phosphatase (KDO 8-P phosphatase)